MVLSRLLCFTFIAYFMVGITFNICAIDTKQKGYTLLYYKNKAENAKANHQIACFTMPKKDI